MTAATLTRRQTRHWLQPIRKAFSEIKAGEVDTIRGYPVTRIDHVDEYARTDWAINGFVALLERLLPCLPADPMRRVANKLAVGTPLVQSEIDACLRLLNTAETALTRIPRATIRQAVLAEQITIELEALGLKEAA